jgi:hypothetical protein
MHKKLIMACMAIAAFAAFVVAPAASASPVLTEGVTPLAVGASIEGRNTGNTLFEGEFNVSCEEAVLKGKVTANTGSKIAGEVPKGSTSFHNKGSTECSSAFGPTIVEVNSALCMETVTGTDNVKVTGCGGAPVTFTLNVTLAGTCRYSTASVTGTYKTNAGATVNLSKQPANKEEPSAFFCPSTGSLTMDFDLYTTGGATQLTVS